MEENMALMSVEGSTSFPQRLDYQFAMHTFGRRLRTEDVSFEDRQDLLGHKSGRITTHYSAAELRNLIAAANKVCKEDSRKTPARHFTHMIRSYPPASSLSDWIKHPCLHD